jgi:hypothetical protein
MADDDRRDERLGRLLEVEPLDELSRRRLVATAMQASAPPARSRLAGMARSRLAAAAAVVAIVVVGGFSYLALRGSDSTAPSASPVRPAPSTLADQSAKSAAPQSGTGEREQSNADSSATAGAAAPRAIGDFGDLRVAANLDRLRAATGASAFSSTTGGEADGTPLVTRLRALPCTGELPEGTIIAIGTGRFGTRDAIVVETSLPEGTPSLDAVVAHPCEVRPLD